MAQIEKRMLFREVNERIRRVNEGFGVPTADYGLFCECDDARCCEQFDVPADIYDEIRNSPNLFLVLPGHEFEREHVLGGNGAYRLVHSA
jgi:hypothetical protein